MKRQEQRNAFVVAIMVLALPISIARAELTDDKQRRMYPVAPSGNRSSSTLALDEAITIYDGEIRSAC